MSFYVEQKIHKMTWFFNDTYDRISKTPNDNMWRFCCNGIQVCRFAFFTLLTEIYVTNT